MADRPQAKTLDDLGRKNLVAPKPAPTATPISQWQRLKNAGENMVGYSERKKISGYLTDATKKMQEDK